MCTDLQSYNLAGMGCSAGVIAVHLAKDLLQTYPNKLALVVSEGGRPREREGPTRARTVPPTAWPAGTPFRPSCTPPCVEFARVHPCSTA